MDPIKQAKYEQFVHYCQDEVKSLVDDCKDPIVLKTAKELFERSILGIEKYHTTLDANPAALNQWAQHAREEALDFANYLQRIQSKLV